LRQFFIEAGRVKGGDRALPKIAEVYLFAADARYYLANALTGRGDFEEAKNHYRQAVEIKPTFVYPIDLLAKNPLRLLLIGPC
jgi:tetratricopeptide (TPR) repeat protein